MSSGDEEALEEELAQLAAALPAQEWQPGAYQQWAALQSESDQHEFASRYLEQLAQLETNYLTTPIRPQEISAETRAVHRGLRLGLDLWIEAMQDCLEGARPAVILSKAELGSRYLVAVQVLERRLRQAFQGFPREDSR